jgi:hypothetical protein
MCPSPSVPGIRCQDVDERDLVSGGDRLAYPVLTVMEREEGHPLPACCSVDSTRRSSWASARGMRPVVTHCHFGLGKLYGRTDKREQAREHLRTATTMYREMGMTYWLERAEAELKGLA